jgi:hypothetical protein
MQAKRASPESFTSEGVKPEDVAAVTHQLCGMIADSGVVPLKLLVAPVAIGFQNCREEGYGGDG